MRCEVDVRQCHVVRVLQQVVEALAAGGALQAVDAAIAAVVEKHDGKLLTEHHGGGELRIHHEVGAVAHHHDHLARGIRHLHAEPAGDLVAHAGIAVFHVVAEGGARFPMLVQLARQAAGGADHHVGRLRRALHRADHLRIGGQFRVGRIRVAGGFVEPAGFLLARLCRPSVGGLPGAERAAQFFQADARIGDQRQRVVLGRIEGLHIEADDAPVRVLEQGPGSGGEVLQARADRDHHIGLFGERVGGARAGHADGAEIGLIDRAAGSTCRPASRRRKGRASARSQPAPFRRRNRARRRRRR